MASPPYAPIEEHIRGILQDVRLNPLERCAAIELYYHTDWNTRRLKCRGVIAAHIRRSLGRGESAAQRAKKKLEDLGFIQGDYFDASAWVCSTTTSSKTNYPENELPRKRTTPKTNYPKNELPQKRTTPKTNHPPSENELPPVRKRTTILLLLLLLLPLKSKSTRHARERGGATSSRDDEERRRAREDQIRIHERS